MLVHSNNPLEKINLSVLHATRVKVEVRLFGGWRGGGGPATLLLSFQ